MMILSRSVTANSGKLVSTASSGSSTTVVPSQDGCKYRKLKVYMLCSTHALLDVHTVGRVSEYAYVAVQHMTWQAPPTTVSKSTERHRRSAASGTAPDSKPGWYRT